MKRFFKWFFHHHCWHKIDSFRYISITGKCPAPYGVLHYLCYCGKAVEVNTDEVMYICNFNHFETL